MAVTFDAVGPSSAGASTSGGGTTCTWSHTSSGTSRLIVVVVAAGNNNPGNFYTITATYNSVNMISAGSANSNNNNQGRVQMFYLVAPATGANTIVVTFTTPGSGSDSLACGSVSFNGVDQVIPIRNFTSTYGRSTSGSIDIRSDIGNMVLDGTCDGRSIISSTQTNRWLDNITTATQGGNGASSTAAGALSVTMAYTYNATLDSWAIVGLDIMAEAPPPSIVPTTDFIWIGGEE